MGISTTEKKLQSLEQQLKSLKSTCQIAGMLAKSYVQTSEEFVITNSQSAMIDLRFRFTPQYQIRGYGLITLSTSGTIQNQNGLIDLRPNMMVEPQTQDGGGVVILRLRVGFVGTLRLRIIASGTSPGRFERIQ